MKNVVIVAACRTPIGKIGGQFKTISDLDLSVPVLKELVGRANIKSENIDDVIWGCNYQRTYKENNLARVAALKAGFSDTVPGITVHRNCTSSMSSIQLGYYQIRAGEAKCIVAGGAESMSNAPHMVFSARFGQKYGHMELRDSMWDSLTELGVGPSMGITAENVAERYNVSRHDMDVYSLRSHQRAIAAIDEGKFKDEIVPIIVKNKKSTVKYDTDELPRRNASLENLEALKTVFKENGTVTAGNSSGMNDAAAGVILMEEETAIKLNVPIIAKVISVATTGVPPEVMGIGPISASKKALEKANLSVDNIDLFEVNEAFASQCIACQRELNIPDGKFNVNGSGISLGHPVGASGSRLVVSLLYEMQKRKGRYGLASLCAGTGMGATIIVEMNY